MWLMNYITKNSISKPNAVKGSFSRGGSEGTAVVSSGEHKEVAQCLPYGVVSVPPNGENAVVLPLDDGEVMLGVIGQTTDLQPGELALVSKGGASVVLKNNGNVLINGKVFS